MEGRGTATNTKRRTEYLDNGVANILISISLYSSPSFLSCTLLIIHFNFTVVIYELYLFYFFLVVQFYLSGFIKLIGRMLLK